MGCNSNWNNGIWIILLILLLGGGCGNGCGNNCC